MDDDEIFRARVKQALEFSGKGQNAVARQAGLAKGTLSNIAKGHQPTAYNLRALCRALGVSADWLLNLKQAPSGYAQRKREALAVRKVLEESGWERQRLALLEGLAALMEALCQEARGLGSPDLMAEKTAEVELLLMQAKLHFDIGPEVGRLRGEKALRVLEGAGKHAL